MARAWMVAAVLIFGGAWTPAEACVCTLAPPPAPYMSEAELDAWARDNARREIVDEFDRAFVVFSGEVIDARDPVHVRFRRDRVWKGTLPEQFWMKTGVERLPDGMFLGNSCNFGMPGGHTFLIFAYGTSIENMRASSCSYSTELQHASRTIEVLGAIVKARALRASSVEMCSCVIDAMPPGLSQQEQAEFRRESLRKQVRTLLENAYAIFSGEVVAANQNTVTFKPDNVWKGDVRLEVAVAFGPFTSPDGTVSMSSCDRTFAVGRKYVIFARASYIATFEAMPCTPTGELKDAEAVVAILNELVPKR